MEKLLLLVIGFASVIAAHHIQRKPPQKIPCSDHIKPYLLGDSIDVPTMTILKVAYEAASDKNIVTAPLGVITLLSLYFEGAGPDSSSEISKFLGGITHEEAVYSFEHVAALFSKISADHFTFVDKISVSDKYSLADKFTAYARDFNCEVDFLDFSNPDKAADKINKWAAEKTKGLISHAISPNQLSADTAVALFNVMYFKGKWQVPFNPYGTKDQNFYVTRDKVIKKPMMSALYSSPIYLESERLDARIIALPYSQDGFRMLVVLPDEVDGLPSVLEKLSCCENGLLLDVYNMDTIYRDVEVNMPKFDIKSKLNFNDILPKLGVSKIFEEGAPGIVKNSTVVVSQVFQEALIKVDEEGATATEVTDVIAVGYSASARPPSLKFTVDRPFLYAILSETNYILFIGVYSG